MRRCAPFLTSRLSVGLPVLTGRVGCGCDAVATAQGVAPTAMGCGALRVPWRYASTSSNSSSGGEIRGSGEESAQLWTMQSRVKDVLLHEFNMEIGKMKLRNFIRKYVGIDYPIEEKDNYIMDFVVTELEEFVTDEVLRRSIESLEPFQQLRDAYLLNERGIATLRQWKSYGEKGIVSLSSQGTLNGVRVQNTEVPQGGKVLSGVYESIYDANWSYVVKSPHGVPDRFWLEVRKEPHSLREWTDEEVDYLTHNVDTETAARIRNAREKELKEDEDNVRPTQGSVVMKVLTSPQGWPYELDSSYATLDCFVTKEVERVWRVVRGDLRDWFEAEPRVLEKPCQRVLIGTPGIGKSMAVGSYLLHQLLHYDAKILPVVAYFIGKKSYIFNKTTKQVTVYDNVRGLVLVKRLAKANYNGYTIYDCSKAEGEPPVGLPQSWGTVVISSPNENNFKSWEKQKTACRFIINCPEESDIKAMCAWKKRGQPDDLQKYWADIKDRMPNVGPTLRYIFDLESYNEHCEAVDGALGGINSETVVQYYRLGVGGFWRSDKVSYEIVKATRVVRRSGAETFFNEPICPKAKKEIQNAVSGALKTNAALMATLLPLNELIPIVLKTLGVKAFKEKKFMQRIHDKLTEFHPKDSKRKGKSWVLYENIAAYPDDWIPVPPKSAVTTKKKLQYKKLYIPSSETFPVVGAFFFVEEPKTIVGVQVAKSKYHPATTSEVKALREYLAALFVDGDSFPTDLSWEIIYVQHADNKAMTNWQECKMDLSQGQGPEDDMIRGEHESIAKHWNEEVYQYHLKISP